MGPGGQGASSHRGSCHGESLGSAPPPGASGDGGGRARSGRTGATGRYPSETPSLPVIAPAPPGGRYGLCETPRSRSPPRPRACWPSPRAGSRRGPRWRPIRRSGAPTWSAA
ncbi:MAG: hypothetical protein AVDCRST_MAG49-1022 [uncultured Thermomicrobiales bacterium]|uniref:Uncharacterized protein n=1 Tax=uncultured Thermomicrobiales bacterium TaxID=1645740 RepID=A0A6J4UBB4_9BACT|nr:MAG: hypothetical protein AVDCRST_MAG49-1022 [uncultured Thermomicrobiales bacterium]